MNESFIKRFQYFRQIKETLVFIIDPHKEKVTELRFHPFGIEIVAFEMYNC